MIPAAGSAYSYAYASLGEMVAWIIGWALTLEYAVGAATVSVSWSGYVVSFLGKFGLALPHALTASPFDTDAIRHPAPGLVNLPAMFIIVLVSMILIRGISESAKVNAVIVAVKLAVVAALIGFGALYVKPENWHPFIPPNAGTVRAFRHLRHRSGARPPCSSPISASMRSARRRRKPRTRARHADRHPGVAGRSAPCFTCSSAWS